MAPSGPCPLLFLTLILLAAGLAQFRPRDTCEWFVREHVDFPNTSATNDHRCYNFLMLNWNLTSPFCKPTHTFILAPASRLRAICGHGVMCDRCHHCDSNAAYPMTTCRMVPGSRPGCCMYRGRAQTSRIHVTCGQGRPVDFDRVL
ncbi:interleukin-8-like [Platysternon megacephalum]|uniref:Interleukin-8-like n=1 Tax=Platysternon megacephalum TaxID=55544 RepID=A0A4D9DR94_9SAUR|nr:interleukin-8-like [Platysternon megacephalum]